MWLLGTRRLASGSSCRAEARRELAGLTPGVSEQRLAADGGNTPGPEWRPGGRTGLEGRQVVRRVLLRRNIVIDAETAQLVAAAVQAALQSGAPSQRPRRRPRVPPASCERLF